MNNQPHRVDFHRPTRPVEGCTINVQPEQAPDTGLAAAEETVRALVGYVADGHERTALLTVLAEYNRRGTAEQALARLLAVCDDNERHIRANVPHLPPDGGSLSVHAIRKILGARSTPGAPTPAEAT